MWFHVISEKHVEIAVDEATMYKHVAEATNRQTMQQIPLHFVVRIMMHGALRHVCNNVLKSREILMFVCLQKDTKQWCDITKLDCTSCFGYLTKLRFLVSCRNFIFLAQALPKL